MMYKLVWLEGGLCLLLGALACQFWHAARWKVIPYQCDRRDWVTSLMLRSFWACLIVSAIILLLGILWIAWLFVEYVAWTSPEVRAAFKEAASQGISFAKERHYNDFSGRIASFPLSAFGIGCSAWTLYWLWKARSRFGLLQARNVP